MRRIFLIALAAVLPGLTNGISADSFSDGRLLDKTLRINYIFTGSDKDCDIAVAELLSAHGWYGRRTNLKEVPLRGNGQLTMTDKATGDTLYRMSFCTLFQEWQATEEATRVRKSFENVFLVPMPAAPAEITVQLYDFHENVAAKLTHPVDPKDILIRPVGGGPQTRMLLHSGDSKEKIDVAILAEGYTEGEMDIFFKDAESTVENLLRHEPFKSMKDRFNIVASRLLPRTAESACRVRGCGKRRPWTRTSTRSIPTATSRPCTCSRCTTSSPESLTSTS